MKKLFIALLLVISFSASALTAEQKATLKTAALAEPTIATCITGGNDVCVADWFNTPSTFVVWRNLVTQTEYQTSEAAGTAFNWSGTGGFISRTQGERDAWRTMFQSGSVDPSKANVIAAFSDIFSGSGAGAVATRLHLLTLSKRLATNAEKALATGTGSDASPGKITYQGKIIVSEISDILG